MDSSPLLRGVFALLVAATVAAFVLAQSLKGEVPVVLRFTVAAPFALSPNGDGVRDRLEIGFDLSEEAEVSFSIIDSEGQEVRRVVDDRTLAGDAKHRFTWNGRDDEGEVAPDGPYRMRLVRRKEGSAVNSFKELEVDTQPPDVTVTSATPSVVDPTEGPVSVRVGYAGPPNPRPEFRVYRTDGGAQPRVVRRFRGNARKVGTWDGSVIGGGLAPDGTYAFQVRVRDRAGNETLGPLGEPSGASSASGAGLAVRRLELRGPLGLVGAGTVARLEVGPTPRRYEFELVRLGSARALRSGSRRGGALRVTIPDDARTGVFLVRVRSRGRSAVWPLAVAGTPVARGAVDRPRPLVVLPVITWQGRNELDSDRDGFADTLDTARSLPAERPFAGGELPPAFRREAAPLLRHLDRERLPYDLTTDLSLARREGPALGNAPGVAVAGTAEWLTRRVRDDLRAEVEENGLKLVSFGAESLRRTVALVDSELRDPSPPRPDDLFGERTELFRADPPAPLRAERDALGLFEEVDELFGEFSVFERSVALDPAARLRSSAGRDVGEPAFVAYRLGEGTVIRPGTPQWARELRERRLGVEVPQVTNRIWRLLSRRG